MREYPLDEFMIVDDLDPYPSALWEWGVQNRNGFLHQKPIDFVRFCLLPREEASVTRDGIYFKRLHYTCKLAIQKNWFVEARRKSSWKITVAYDPRLVDQIYISQDNGQFEVCNLLKDDQTFLGCSFREVEEFYRKQAEKKQSRKTKKLRSSVEKQDKVEEIIDREKAKVSEANNNQSKTAQIKNIKANRAAERKHDSHEQAQSWQPKPQEVDEPTIPTSIVVTDTEAEDSEYVPPHRLTQKLRDRRQITADKDVSNS